MKITKGFTLVEILIAVAILGLVLPVAFISLRGQTVRAADAQRKTDLYKLHTALQEYANDNNDAFPAAGIVSACNGSDLSPYIAKIPCDPVAKNSYGYFPVQNGGYRLCAKLSDATDPAIAAMGCGGPEGCGLGGGYNYCLASGVTASAVGTVDQVGGGATPTPGGGGTSTPTPTPYGAYACAPPDLQGVSRCNHYGDPVGSGCPRIFADSQCDGLCDTDGGALWCQQ